MAHYDFTEQITRHEQYDNGYLSRCVEELKRREAPLSGWKCIRIADVREDDRDAQLSVCELCGCAKVRFEHYMMHPQFPQPISVGCVCAGIMEGNILKARERERIAKNRSARRRRFAAKAWFSVRRGVYTRQYNHRNIRIIEMNGLYTVEIGRLIISKYKGKPISNILSAGYAAFDAIDPPDALI